jgi:putative alpha-1,2-mannosidase
MVQLSPDTRPRSGDWDGCSGYHYSDSLIYGFSHTHLSGTGCDDWCDILVTPGNGPSRFSHSREQAAPGYYQVFLEDPGVWARLTAGRRTGVHEYTFPKGEKAVIRIDLRHRDVLLDGEKILEGIEGRVVELDIHLRCADPNTPYQKFIMKFAQNEKYHSVLSYRPYESWLQIDRKFSGSRRAYIHQRRCLVSDQQGEIRLHVILDRFSMEVFINDGEQVMTATILTGSDARKISFEADGKVMMDITKYSLTEKE